MKKNTVVKVNNLSKKYQIGKKENYLALRDKLVDMVKKPQNIFKKKEDKNYIWALKNISFSVKKGEVVGIIGRNGAGKTTLLKVLSKITRPTKGEAKLRGRTSSLLEVGTGFNPELTGRENIYLNGAILGMRKGEIENKFNDIVKFSGVEQFLDTPVKHYSSGMRVRLAFSVAAHLEPEILLIDEVLAVGDVEFQKKCLGKMKDVATSGRTILFVSHNMGAIKNLCQRVLLFKKGRVIEDGRPDKVIKKYYNSLEAVGSKTRKQSLAKRKDREGTGQVKVTNIEFSSVNGSRIIKSGGKARIKINYLADKKYSTANVILSFISNPYGDLMFRFRSNNSVAGIQLKRKGKILCYTDKLNIMGGRVHINIGFFIGGVLADYVKEAVIFDIIDNNYLGYPCQDTRKDYYTLIKHRWQFK